MSWLTMLLGQGPQTTAHQVAIRIHSISEGADGKKEVAYSIAGQPEMRAVPVGGKIVLRCEVQTTAMLGIGSGDEPLLLEAGE